MTTKILARTAAALVVAVTASAAMIGGATTAEAGKMRIHIAIGGPVKMGIHYPGYRHYHYAPRPCRWLKREALSTGSPFWWRKYRRCMWRHGY